MHATAPVWRRVLACLALAALGACAVPGADSGPGGQSRPTGDDVVRVVEGLEHANLVLYVSNQSFEHGRIRIDAEIDGVPVVGEDFDVEGQHNWVEFPIALPPGDHTLTAVSGTDVEATHTFTVPEGETRWAVLDYWYYPESDDGSDHVPPSFTFDVFDEQVAFA